MLLTNNGALTITSTAVDPNDVAYQGGIAVKASTGQVYVEGGGGSVIGTINNPYDLLIYGATFEGIMCAIEGVKCGMSVVIIEPRLDFGGMVTNGVMFTDAHVPTGKTSWNITGLTRKFYLDAAAFLLLDPQVYLTTNSYGLESKTAKNMLAKLIGKYKIPVINNAKLVSVDKTSTVINSCTFDTIGNIYAKQYHDATYHGDLVAGAGCDYIIGREASATYSEGAYNAGYYISSGQNPTKSNTTLSWSGGIVTGTTAWVTGFTNGDAVNITIAGATPSGYNGNFIGTMTGASSFTYPLASDPGLNTVLGTVAWNVDAYNTVGVSASGTIQGLETTLSANGSTVATIGNVQTTGIASPLHQAMGFRLAVTFFGSKVAFTAPTSYDPLRYEILRRWMKAYGQQFTTFSQMVLFQVTIPSNDATDKQDINNKNIMGVDYVHPESTEWALTNCLGDNVTSGWARRAQIEENIRQYVLGFLYFCQNDASVPSAVRTNAQSYGFCADEYIDTGNMPRYPYVRQGRRLIGDTVTKASDLQSISLATTGLALAYYTFDEHPCQYINNGGNIVFEGGLTGGAVPSKITRSAVVPKAAQCTNLTAGFCGSMSQVAFSSIRLEPIMGALGQACARIAYYANKHNQTVQAVSLTDIKRDINLFGWEVPNALRVSADGTYADGSATISGFSPVAVTGLYGVNNVYTCSLTSGANTVTLTPSTTRIRNGYYDVYIAWADSNPATTRGSPTITVTANAIATSIVVNQSNSGDGGNMYYLGRFYFKKGSAVNNNILITHDNNASAFASNVIGAMWVPVLPEQLTNS